MPNNVGNFGYLAKALNHPLALRVGARGNIDAPTTLCERVQVKMREDKHDVLVENAGLEQVLS